MLTENAIKLIEQAIGITGLQEMITSNDALDITPKKTKHFDEVSFKQMTDNLTSSLPAELYKEAKEAGEEIAVKEIKRANGFEFEGKKVKDLTEYLSKQIELKSKTDSTEIEKRYQKEIEDHKKLIESERKEKENLALLRKQDKINWIVDNHFNSLQIDVPGHLKDAEQINSFRKNEIEKNKIYFKSQYQFDVDDFGNIIVKDLTGNVQKDELLNPVKIDNVVKDFAAKNFITYGQQGIKGRGGKDEYPGNNLLSGIDSLDKLYDYAEKNGIKKNTSEFDAIYAEYSKNNKK